MLIFGNKNDDRRNDAGGENSGKRGSMNSILFIIVGLYLIYLAWKLVSENLAVGIRGDNWYFYLAAVVFVLVGIFSIVRSVLQLKAEAARSKREYEEFLREQREEEELLAKAKYLEEETGRSEEDGDE